MLILFQAQAFKKPVEKSKADLSNLSEKHIESWIKFTNQLGYLGININEMKPEEIEKRIKEINKDGKIILVLSGRDVQNLQEIFKTFGYEFQAEVLAKDSYLATKFEEYKQKFPNIDDAIEEFVKYANLPSTQKIWLGKGQFKVEKIGTDENIESNTNESFTIVQANLNNFGNAAEKIGKKINELKSEYGIGASTGTGSQSSTYVAKLEAKEQKEIKGKVKPEERSKLISAIEKLKSIKIQIGQNKDKTPITKELGNLDKAVPKIKKLEEGTFSEGESVSFNMKKNTEMMNALKEIAKYWTGGENLQEKVISDNHILYLGMSPDKQIGYEVKYQKEKGFYIFRRLTQNEILNYTSTSVTKQKEENNEERKMEPISFKDTPITIEGKTITFRAKTLDRAYKGENFVINPDALQFDKNVSIQAKQNIADKFAEELSNKIASMGLKASIKYVKRTEQGDTWKLIIEKTQ
jgi:hypothetical protein